MEQFQVLYRELDLDKENAKEEIKQLEQKIQQVQQQSSGHRGKKEIVQEYINPSGLSRPIVECLIDHIEVSRRDPETKMIKIEIHWNF